MIFKRCHTDLPDIPSYSDRCLSLNLQTLKLRRDIFDITFFHNLRLHPDLISTKNLPQPKCHRFSLRKKSPFLHPHVRTTLRRNSFFVRTLKTYNSIPERRILSSQDVNVFRAHLAKFLSESPS
jgi:hypothetical protein